MYTYVCINIYMYLYIHAEKSDWSAVPSGELEAHHKMKNVGTMFYLKPCSTPRHTCLSRIDVR